VILDTVPSTNLEIFLAWMIVVFCAATIIINFVLISRNRKSVESKILFAQNIPLFYAGYLMLMAAENRSHLFPVSVRSALLLILTTQLMKGIIKIGSENGS